MMILRKWRLWLAAVAGVLLLSGGASAATAVTVCPAGPPLCDYATIQAALDVVPDKATIEVGPGLYGEALTVRRTVTLVAAAGPEVTIVAAAGAPALSSEGGSSLTIDGFTFRRAPGAAPATMVGIDIVQGLITIVDSVVEGLTAVEGHDAIGIRYRGGGWLILENVLIRDLAAGEAAVDGDEGGTAVGVLADGDGQLRVVDSTIADLEGGSAIPPGGWVYPFCTRQGGHALGIATRDDMTLTVRRTTVERLAGGAPCYRYYLPECGIRGGSAQGIDADGGRVWLEDNLFHAFMLRQSVVSRHHRAVWVQNGETATLIGNHFTRQPGPPHTGAIMHPHSPICPPAPRHFTAILITDTVDVLATNNRIDGLYGRGVTGLVQGIRIEGAATAVVDDNDIVDLHGGNMAENAGIRIDDSETVVVSANVIGRIAGHNAPPMQSIFDSGTDGGSALGIMLIGIGEATVVNNILWSFTAGEGTSPYQAEGRAGGDAIGVKVSDSAGVIANNVVDVSEHGRGGVPNGPDGRSVGLLLENSQTMTVTNNYFGHHLVGVEVDGGVSYAEGNAFWNNDVARRGVPPGVSDIAAPPAFVQPARGDYRLQHQSPLIDAGVATGSPATDWQGTRRAQDGDENGVTAVDIGAEEYWRGWRGSSLTVTPAKAAPGEVVTYAVHLVNENGRYPLMVTLTDTVPAGLTVVPGSLTADAGLFYLLAGTVHWSVTVPIQGQATLSFDAVIDSAVHGPRAFNNEARLDDGVARPGSLWTPLFVEPWQMYLPVFAYPSPAE